MTTAHEALKAARALIADERNWIKGEAHRVLDGRDCYCALGALSEAEKRNGYPRGAYSALCDVVPAGWVASFNDNPDTTHADVLAMFDRAIEATAP